MLSNGDLEVEVLIAVPPGEVWQALVDADHRRPWWSYLELDPVAGGRFSERWTADGREVVTSGSVMEVIPERLLRMTWSDDNWPDHTEVEIRMTPSILGTHVRVRQSGWGRLPDGERLAEEHRQGWRMHLSHLRDHVESNQAGG